jgi:hypothetical protein
MKRIFTFTVAASVVVPASLTFAQAQIVEAPAEPEACCETQPDPAIQGRGRQEGETYQDWLDRQSDRADILGKSQEAYLEYRRVLDERRHSAVTWFMDQGPSEALAFEPAFRDHGDTVQILAFIMEPTDKERISWKIVAATPLHSGKTIGEALTLSVGGPGAQLWPGGRTDSEVTLYHAVLRQADGSWKRGRLPLQVDDQVRKQAADSYEKTMSVYQQADDAHAAAQKQRAEEQRIEAERQARIRETQAMLPSAQKQLQDRQQTHPRPPGPTPNPIPMPMPGPDFRGTISPNYR